MGVPSLCGSRRLREGQLEHRFTLALIRHGGQIQAGAFHYGFRILEEGQKGRAVILIKSHIQTAVSQPAHQISCLGRIIPLVMRLRLSAGDLC